MRRILVMLVILFASAGAKAEDRRVYLITLADNIINPVSAEYIIKSIEKAQQEKAECIIIELDTPGGLLTSTRTIVKAIMNADVPVVVWVAPAGSRAGSAGVFITLAGHIAAMAPSTNIGAAHPVSLEDKRPAREPLEELLRGLLKKKDDGRGTKDEGRGTRDEGRETRDEGRETPARRSPPEADEGGRDEREPMEDKILNDTIAWAKTIASSRGRNERWAVRAVTESISITETQALKDNVIDLIASNTLELLDKIDGREVLLPSGRRTLSTKEATVVEIPMNFRTRLLGTIAHPNIILILMMLGFYGLMFEFTHPGAGFPGVAGLICLILAFFGMQVLPTNYAGLALILLAIILFIAEIKVVSYGLLTLGGLVSLLLGSLILFPSPYGFMRVSIPLVLALVGATLVIVIFLTTIVLRASRRRVETGLEGLIGERGEVRQWSEGRGKVFVHGELWNAESSEVLEKEMEVEVIRIDGMRLIIRKRP